MRNVAVVAVGGLLFAFAGVSAKAQTLYATNGTGIVSFTAQNPGTLLTNMPFTYVPAVPGETIVGIDVNPVDGFLYGVGSTSRLYKIVAATGVATQVGSGQFTTLVNGTSFGVDFDTAPVAPGGELRIVSDNEQNMRVDPTNGTLLGVHGNLNPAGNVVAAAYAFSNILYGIDSVSGSLQVINPASGALTLVGPLGLGTNLNPGIGFDHSPVNGIAYASVTVGAQYQLYSINLPNGNATLIGQIGTGTYPLLGLAVAVVPEPGGVMLLLMGGCAMMLRQR